MRELPHLLPDLDPPAGGLARLRQSIADAPHQHGARRRGLAWTAAVIVPLLALTIWLTPFLVHRHDTRTLTTALRQALEGPLPPDGLRVEHGDAVELPSGQDNVRLYLVMSVAVPRSDRNHPRTGPRGLR